MRTGALLVLLAFACSARAFDVPPAAGHVTDAAGVLTGEARATLESALAEVARADKIEVAVLTVKSLGGDTVEAAAQKVFDTWKPGARGKDRGLVMLVAVDDRKVRLQPGYGLEGDLPDGKIGRILDERVVPLFRSSDWYGGIRGGLDGALTAAGSRLPGGAPAPVRRARDDEVSPLQTLVMLVLFGCLIVGAMFSPTLRFLLIQLIFSGRGGGGRGDGGGDFGGFGGGSSGGGGASRGW